MTLQLSIVIPTFNRAARLRTCMDSLCRQTQPASEFEVIVVLDGSTDESEQMLRAMSTPFTLRVVRQENQGNGAARNHGAEVASAPYLLFLDDDIIASPEAVAEHLRAQREHGGAVVIGMGTKLLSRRVGRFAKCAAEERQDLFRSWEQRELRFIDCWSGILSVPRAAFLHVGGFATDLVREVDTELGYRLELAGLRLVCSRRGGGQEDERETPAHRLADSELRGEVAVELWRRHPPMIASIELGGHWQLGRFWVALRRLCFALHIPPRLLVPIGNLLPRFSSARAWYRLVLSYCYWRGVRRVVSEDTWRGLIHGTPILMYHAIGAPGERASRFVLPAHRFERQLRWLSARGYNVIELDELIRCRKEHRLVPARSVVITFDDGYADNRLLAAPILERWGFPTTVFLVSTGTHNSWSNGASALEHRPLMSLSEARDLFGGVIQFGAHSRTHPDLVSLTEREAEQEIAGSRDELEAALGTTITTFAYPYGSSSPEVREAVQRAGFLGACGVELGRNRLATDPYDLKRLEIRGTDSLIRFALTLQLGNTRSIFRRTRS
jgi:peptidoglycan/xylan/chitin deacetylase (PgdA/CDA1 family)